MYYFEDMIEEIEKDLLTELDVSELAQKMNMSVYEFRRIFTFITKIPLGEYVRKRRLSLAAIALSKGEVGIAEIAGKCGYDSPSSFSRAFKDFHGISPSDVANGAKPLRLLTKISVEITAKGCRDIAYELRHEAAYTVRGLSASSPLSDTECCEEVWSRFNGSPYAEIMASQYDKLYAVYENARDTVKCYIGVQEDENAKAFPDCISLPEGDWACFTLHTTEDSVVNEFYNNVLVQWCASTGYKRDLGTPNVEVFPADMSEDGFAWEIRIPVKKEGQTHA